MKFLLGLFAVLAIIGLGQAHQFPDFGEGPLHEDFQDLLDLVPVEKIIDVVVDYIMHDDELLELFQDLQDNPKIIEDLLVDVQAIPELIKLLNYLQKEGIHIYPPKTLINRIHNIKEQVSSFYDSPANKRTGGLAGFFKDIKKHIDYEAFLSVYVDKLKTSTAFAKFINQLKSDNFQQLINKICKVKSVEYILKRLDARFVNLKFASDVMYLLFGINIPSLPSKTLMEEFLDFALLIPVEKYLDIVIKYINEDEKVQKALLFMFTDEFHKMLRSFEALKEHQALVIYLEKIGIPIIEYIQYWHHAIGMEGYVPPKIDLRLYIKTQKVGDGMIEMIKDLYNVLPLDKIDDLYKEKMKISRTFVTFITKITSKEMIKILNDLIAHTTYKEFITKSKAKGLYLEELGAISVRMIGLKSKY
ncbi:hypothetical protein P5V15_006740 [Pogonomyrmex californicus]